MERLRESKKEARGLGGAIPGKKDAILGGDAMLGEKAGDESDRDRFCSIVVERMNEGAAILSAAGTVLFCNRRMVEMAGSTAEGMAGRSLLSFFSQQAELTFGKLVTQALENEGQVEGRFLRKDRTAIPVQLLLSPVTLAGPEQGICLIATDQTQQKQSDQELRDRADLLGLAQDAIIVKDMEHRILFWNRGAETLYGWTAEEARGKLSHELLRTGFPDSKEAIHSSLLLNRTWQGELTQTTRRDNSILVASRWSVRSDEQGRPTAILEINRDITERRHFEREMLQAQKLEAIGRLAGGIAHDFSNMLNIILGYCQMMQESVSKTDTVLRKRLAEVKQAAERATGVTRQLLAFSRKQPMQVKPVRLGEVIRDCATMLQSLVGEKIDLTITNAPDLGMVKADPTQIQQVLINLVVNARDAMPHGGKVQIVSRNCKLDEHYARVRQPVVPGNYVMISVSDTGIGMHETTISHIFEPFFTTKEAGEGTGFGLSISYGIIKQSGGYIWVYSEPGHGSTFKVYIPRLTEESAKVVSVTTKSRRKKAAATILVVEDEDPLANMVFHLLTQNGYAVLQASSAEDALQVSRGYAGAINLMLIDVILRGAIDGPELARKIGTTRPSAKLLYMSGYGDALNRFGSSDGRVTLLEKPFTADDLLRRVQEALEGKLEGQDDLPA